MSDTKFYRLLPTLEMLAEALPGCTMVLRDPEAVYRSVLVFRRQPELEAGAIYLLRQQDASFFPVDQQGYLCVEPISGNANHIFCPGQDLLDLLDRMLHLFSALREQEIRLDQLVYHNAGLTELCTTGAGLLGNPVCIHDDWFINLAMSQMIENMEPEYIMSNRSGFVPQTIVDDFKHDSDYLETFAYHTPQIWCGTPNAPRSLYVNLWEGSIYRGRLLVLETEKPFQKKDFLIAALLAQHAVQMLRKRTPGLEESQGMDDLIRQLLQGDLPDQVELNQVLHSLNWNYEDKFCLIRIRSQQGISPAMDHMLHTDLFRSFPQCYILLGGHQQCLILNLTRQPTTLPVIRHTLAPTCRDYCLYAGISSPVNSVRNLHLAYFQSGIALDEAFRARNEKWILPFSDCALEYWFEHLSGELKTQHLVSPELTYLIQYDQENGTEYFETLREYLLQERNIPRTSEKLIIHRTTLLYRLKKIQALVSLNLEDPKNRLYLLLSLQILQNAK